MDGAVGFIVMGVLVLGVLLVGGIVVWNIRKHRLWQHKNFERGLKMVTMMISLPPATDDIEGGGRDKRDVTEETISQSQSMYSIISSIALKGFKSRLYGQRHISFEIVASNGIIHFYVTSPYILADTIEQAVLSAYPTASLKRVHDENIFSEVGKLNGTIGGEFSLKKEYAYPIATYQQTKKDAMRAILNVMSQAGKEDGIAMQIMMRPAREGWRETGDTYAKNLREGRKADASSGGGAVFKTTGYMKVLAKPLDVIKEENKSGDPKPISKNNEALIEALEEKNRYSGYETLIRVVVSSNVSARAQSLLNNLVAVFAQFDSPTGNGLKFSFTGDVQKFVTSYIMRYFPQSVRLNILNTIELATIFHLPDQSNIPTSALERQEFKQVDGPTKVLEKGLLLGENVFRGIAKPIRLSDSDRRRHIYIMGATGMGKSVLLENLAMQDMLEGRGFCFVDPHGDSVEKLLGMVPRSRVEDIVLFDPGDLSFPIGMNMFEIDPNDPDRDKTKDFIISEMVSMLYSLYDPGHTGIVGPRMENIVRNAAHLLMDSPDGGTFMDIPKVLIDPEYTKLKLQHLRNARAMDFWTKEWPAAQKSNDAGEVTSWVVSKWAQFETTMMRNILGQLKSGLNLREIMDNRKILLINLSKGKVGELNAKLLGMLFVMKFQAAAMSRVNTPESEREDFCLFVDEFQNFATDSFESILSEARKFRLNLIVANQFMTQLTDRIRSAIIGNAGSFIIGRSGFEDAEQIVKQFQPTFDMEDLQRLPNYMAISKVLVDGYPSRPFTMRLLPPMGNPNPQLADAVKRLSAAKYGRTRAEVEREINERLSTSAANAMQRAEGFGMTTAEDGHSVVAQALPQQDQKKTSFLDDWLTKRSQLQSDSADTNGTSTIGNPKQKDSVLNNDQVAPLVNGRVIPKAEEGVLMIDRKPQPGTSSEPASHNELKIQR